MVYNTGALVVRSRHLFPALIATSKIVTNVLYMPIASESKWNTREALKLIKDVYVFATMHCPMLDIRLLLPLSSNASTLDKCNVRASTQLEYGNVEVLISHTAEAEETKHLSGYKELSTHLEKNHKMEYMSFFDIMKLRNVSDNILDHQLFDTAVSGKQQPIQLFQDALLGGTFDNLHNGHRLFLTQSALLTEHRLVVGVAGGHLITSKDLHEFMDPWEV